jgi:hypothetical protein
MASYMSLFCHPFFWPPALQLHVVSFVLTGLLLALYTLFMLRPFLKV